MVPRNNPDFSLIDLRELDVTSSIDIVLYISDVFGNAFLCTALNTPSIIKKPL